MSIADRIIYQRPTEPRLYVEKQPVPDTTCPQCGSTDIARYPVAWSRGPRMVTKCQQCYTSLAVERPTPEENWPPFRAVAYDWDVSAAERPSTLSTR